MVESGAALACHSTLVCSPDYGSPFRGLRSCSGRGSFGPSRGGLGSSSGGGLGGRSARNYHMGSGSGTSRALSGPLRVPLVCGVTRDSG